MTATRLYDYVDGLIRKTFRSGPVPTLYHYTTQGGLEGIIGSRQYRATHFSRMDDDPDELRHADELIATALARVSKVVRTEWPAREVITRFEEWHATDSISKARIPIWLGCFCEQRDDPKLWDKFGKKGDGFCIGFAHVTEPYPPVDGIAPVIAKVVYDAEKRIDGLRTAFTQLLREVNKEGSPEAVRIAVTGMMRMAAIANITYKAPRFAFEREWRLALVREIEDETTEPRLWNLRANNRAPVISTVDVGCVQGDAGVRLARELFERLGYGANAEMPGAPEILLSTYVPDR